MIEIRPGTDGDAAALAAIDAVTWTSATSPAGVPDEPRPFFRAEENPSDTLVAVLDGAVVGYARLRNALPVPSHLHVLEINGLAVDPDTAGRGIGLGISHLEQRNAPRHQPGSQAIGKKAE